MNTFPKLTATENFYLQSSGDNLIDVKLYNLSSSESESVLDFHRDNYLDSFYYYLNTSRGYNASGTAFYYDTDSCKFVLAKDATNNKDNLAINASLATSLTTSAATYTDTFSSEEATLFISQEYVSGVSDECYLKVSNSYFTAKVKIDGNYIYLAVATDNESHIRKIPLSTQTYTLCGDTYTRVVYGIAYNSNYFVISHNGVGYKITLDTAISDMSGITITNGDTSYKNINNIIAVEQYSDENFLKGLTQEIDNTITVTLGSLSATLSSSCNSYLYAKERKTCQFMSRDITSSSNSSGTYNIKLKLQEV